MFSLGTLDEDLDRFSAASSHLSCQDLIYKTSQSNTNIETASTDSFKLSDSFMSASMILVREMGWDYVRTGVLQGFEPSGSFHLSVYPIFVILLLTDATMHQEAFEVGEHIARKFQSSAFSQAKQIQVPTSFVQMLCMYPVTW